MAATLTIVLPTVTNDAVTRGLIRLTRAIDSSGTTAVVQGVLGGQYGYGADYENEVFMMHPYCWCEKPGCPWCVGCECLEKDQHYFIGEREVSYELWRDEYSRTGNTLRSERQDNPCAFCRDEVVPAPNFLHKASGFKVHWYKYAGRDMEISSPNGVRFSRVLKECLQSLPASSRPGRPQATRQVM